MAWPLEKCIFIGLIMTPKTVCMSKIWSWRNWYRKYPKINSFSGVFLSNGNSHLLNIAYPCRFDEIFYQRKNTKGNYAQFSFFYLDFSLWNFFPKCQFPTKLQKHMFAFLRKKVIKIVLYLVKTKCQAKKAKAFFSLQYKTIVRISRLIPRTMKTDLLFP